jgi:hypothetical protein
MPDTADAKPFSCHIPLDGPASFSGQVEASDAERARLSAFLRIDALPAFRFTYLITPLPLNRYRLNGELYVQLQQACVLTLDSVTETIEEPVSVEFWPADQISTENTSHIDALSDDFPEEIVDGKIDVGVFAVEVLASLINPYPRVAGAEFAWEDPKEAYDTEPAGPFAQLAKLRTDR